MFLVVSRLDVHFGSEHPFFACPIRHASEIVRPKIQAPKKKFVHPCDWINVFKEKRYIKKHVKSIIVKTWTDTENTQQIVTIQF